jgi:oligopeptide/dipeptide ABC transporter ATP-binding protein
MYLGSIVEIADSQGLYKHARHPYTQALLSAIPSMDEANRRERIVLKGEIPSPVDLPTGCSFHTRCNHVMECCCKHQPDFRSMEDGSRVACFLYEEGGR